MSQDDASRSGCEAEALAANPGLPDAWLERLTVFVLATGLVGLGLALTGGFVSGLAVVIGLLATLLYHWLARRADAQTATAARAIGGPQLRWQHLLPVLVLALLFRLVPYPYVLGGQDEGVYTNVAAHIVRSHGIAVDDPAWTRLSDTSARAAYIADNYNDPFLPGVYTIPGETPGFVFQFYHLFPVWLAIFGGLFGIGASFYGLSFLSLVAVLFFQRLAISLSGSERVGLAAGLLFAINPLLAFFSKFPLSEIPALAFSLAGFAWLARFAQAADGTRRSRWLWLSAGCFASLFLTRLSGFMYLPILFALAWLVPLLDPDAARARAISRWAYACIGLYAVSVGYGLVWSGPYSNQSYDLMFGLAIGPAWPTVLLLVSAAAGVASLLLARLSPGSAVAERLAALVRRAEGLLGPALLLVLALGAWKLYQLGFGTRYLHDPFFVQFPGIAGLGWASLGNGSLVAAAVYLCPLVAIAYVGLAQRRWTAPGARLLLPFVLCFVAYAAVLNWILPYQPYYARYLSSELVPYVLVFVCCCMAWLESTTARRLLAVALLLSGLYSAVLSSAQLGRVENAGALDGIGQIAAFAGDDDVLLLDRSAGQGFTPEEVKTPLVYMFGRNVVSAGSASLDDVGFLAGVAGAYDQVFLVTASAAAPPGFVRTGVVRLRVSNFAHGAHPPRTIVTVIDAPVWIYRLVSVAFAPGRTLSLDAARDARVLTQVGRRRHGVGLVSSGRAGVLAYGPYLTLPPGIYQLQVQANDAQHVVHVDVTMAAGSRVLASAGAPASDGAMAAFVFEVPEPGARDLEVRAVVPAGATASLRGYIIRRLR